MTADVQISFRGMESSPSVEAQVRRKAKELQQFSDRVSTCRIMLEAVNRRHRQGTIYHVRVDLTAPGGEVVVNREPGEDHAHEDLHVALLHGGSQGGTDLYKADELRDANRKWLRDTDHAVQCSDGNCDLTLLSSQTASAKHRTN